MTTLEDRLGDEGFLVRVRSRFFPALDQEIITGYDILTDSSLPSGSPFILSYAHSDLTPRYRHHKELFRILELEGFLEMRSGLSVESFQVRDRYAAYVQDPRWKAGRNIRCFKFDGTEISLGEAVCTKREFVVEQRQYELRLKADDEVALRRIIDVFKRFTSKVKLGFHGGFLRDKEGKVVENTDNVGKKNYIYNSWNVPLMTLAAKKKPSNLRDFLLIYNFSIPLSDTQGRVFVRSLVRGRADDFKQFLTEQCLTYSTEKRYALRVFIDEYVEA